jgi:hypothetical protein
MRLLAGFIICRLGFHDLSMSKIYLGEHLKEKWLDEPFIRYECSRCGKGVWRKSSDPDVALDIVRVTIQRIEERNK